MSYVFSHYIVIIYFDYIMTNIIYFYLNYKNVKIILYILYILYNNCNNDIPICCCIITIIW